MTFSSPAALQAFAATIRGSTGLHLIATSRSLQAVRLAYASLEDLAAALNRLPEETFALSPNPLMSLPLPPPREEREAFPLVPLGNRLLEFLGVRDANREWGRGVTVAILDAAVDTDPTFDRNRLQIMDLGIAGIPSQPSGELGHGTAVAALAVGALPDARGVAPAANLLAIPVIAEDGFGDVFTVAEGIVRAVDAGAQIINLSLGAPASSPVLQQALDYAFARDVAIVAAAGNDQSSQLAWPAADPRVISVGAVDALGRQVPFSNAGPQLQITAPGYGVQTAWTDTRRVLFDGTSASAPIVAGAIAAVMSEKPGTTASAAWEILRTHAAEAGPAGPDPAYGNGIIDLGWALHHDDPTRSDPAIASLLPDIANNTLTVVIQNRSAIPLTGADIEISAISSGRRLPLEPVPPGATVSIAVPMTSVPGRQMPPTLEASLHLPPGLQDAVPANNHRQLLLPDP